MIKNVKLVSGEELVVTVVENGTSEISFNDTLLNIERSLILVPHVTQEGQTVVGFAPYMPFAQKGQIALNISNIVAIADVSTNLEEEYKKVFSPIIQPESGVITAN